MRSNHFVKYKYKSQGHSMKNKFAINFEQCYINYFNLPVIHIEYIIELYIHS